MARKKKSGGIFGLFSKKKKTKRSKRKNSDSFAGGLKVALSIMFLTILVAGGAIGLIYMDRYVKNAAKEESENGMREVKSGQLQLIGAPTFWLNEEWQNAIIEAAGGETFPLDTKSAQMVSERLSALSWLYNVQVQTTPKFLDVRADYRMPVALVQVSRNRKVYLDVEMTVLDYIPVAAIPVIEIKGLASTKVPDAGQKWEAGDAAAAVELLNLLHMADLHFQQEIAKRDGDSEPATKKKIPEKPLLDEIESIDVSNFAARKSRSAPNIVLNVVDGTKVYWGAAWGQATVYFEVEEKYKLSGLYEQFVDYGNTLQEKVKYIELRWPKDSIPRPR